jgi:hypothetical protein
VEVWRGGGRPMENEWKSGEVVGAQWKVDGEPGEVPGTYLITDL